MFTTINSLGDSGKSLPHGIRLDAAGNIDVASGREAQRQRLFVTLLAQKTEWHYDRSVGMPYRGTLPGRGSLPEKLTAIEREIESVPGIESVTGQLRFDRRSRHLRLDFVVRGTD